MDAAGKLQDEGVPAIPVLPDVPAAIADADDGALRSLTKRMCSGAEDAFREFHASWFERIFRYAFVLMRGDEHAARDVVQETLLRVVRHIRAFDKEEDLWSWLTCLARSAAADHGRRVSRYRRLLEKFAGETRPMDELQTAPDFNEALQRGLNHIGEDERTLLRRKYDEGASVRQLADDAGVSESAIESRLSRARRELRTIVFRLTGHEKE